MKKSENTLIADTLNFQPALINKAKNMVWVPGQEHSSPPGVRLIGLFHGNDT